METLEGAEYSRLRDINGIYEDILPLHKTAFEQGQDVVSSALAALPSSWGLDKAVSVSLTEDASTYDGLRHDEDIFGNDLDNDIRGAGGFDIILGYSGNDTLDGGDDADTLNGGSGTDELLVGDGNDSLRGESGSDTLFGQAGNTHCMAMKTTTLSTVETTPTCCWAVSGKICSKERTAMTPCLGRADETSCLETAATTLWLEVAGLNFRPDRKRARSLVERGTTPSDTRLLMFLQL